jgi:E3 ubiquitin-protein ligase ZNF598
MGDCYGKPSERLIFPIEQPRLLTFLHSDLCVRNKKIFSHEHILHTKQSLEAHTKKEHHFCEYCQLYLYSDDELYVHMRDRHEQCHICKQRGTQEAAQTYYRNYEALERHFRKDHFLCENENCLEKKFVVFPVSRTSNLSFALDSFADSSTHLQSDMDFKAHQLAEHGSALTSRERREALRVDASFTYGGDEGSAAGAGSGAGRRGRGGRAGRGAGNGHASEEDEAQGGSYIANRSTIPGAPPARASRRANFGGSLTSAAPENAAAPGSTQTAASEQEIER